MSHSARIIFAGSPEFAVPTLKSLLASPHTVVTLLTQPDRPAGRGRKLQAGPVKQVAVDAGIPVLQPRSLRDAAIQQELRDLQPDLMVVVAYGMLLPEEVLAIPGQGCLNVHASLLPRWRGASPIQAAILAGDQETGISIMRMDAGLDTGPVYCREKLTIGATETAAELHDRLAEMGGRMLATTIDSIAEQRIKPVEQPGDGVTYAGRITKADGHIDWSRSAIEISRAIRAYNAWPVAQTTLEGEQLRCWAARLSDAGTTSQVMPGQIVKVSELGIEVQTGDGILVLTEVQVPGRKRIAASEFARARQLATVVLGQ